jgi:glycosyltransferase involved in cell wall biosynthesis
VSGIQLQELREGGLQWHRQLPPPIRQHLWAPQVGISRYSRCLLNAMLALGASDLELRTIDLAGSERYQGANSIRVGRGHHFAERFVQEQVAMARVTRDIDLLHLPWYEGPVRASCPLVVNVHDLDTIENRDSYSLRFRTYYNTLLRIYLRTARRIIVPSNATLEALKSRWPRGRYVLIPYGVDPVFEKPPEQMPNSGSPYILYSGGFGARKRLSDLLEAFDRVAEAERDVRLVIVGAAPQEFVRAVARTAARDRIELTGYVEDRQLVSLYRSASVVAYPSVLEGFGFPVLEAFATGTPASSCNRSHPTNWLMRCWPSSGTERSPLVSSPPGTSKRLAIGGPRPPGRRLPSIVLRLAEMHDGARRGRCRPPLMTFRSSRALPIAANTGTRPRPQ